MPENKDNVELAPYIIPKPELIVTEEQAVEFIERLEKHPMAWVYLLAEVLGRPTPKEYIQDREGPQKMKLFYVDGAYAIACRAAMARLGIGSDLEVLDGKTEGEESASALCKLTFKFVHQGQVLTVSSAQWGDCPKRSGMSWGDVRKGAVTDGLKKCMSEFGWAADVYGMAPEKLPAPPTAEEAHAKAVEYVIGAAKEKGVSPDELDDYCKEHWEGKTVSELDQITLTSLRRKIQSKEGLVLSK